MRYLYGSLDALGAKLGAVLFQLPPNLKKDVSRLTAFLALLPANHRAAFEFRNETWFDDEVYAVLEGRRRVVVLFRARRQRAAAVGGDRALGVREAAARTLFRR